MGQRGNATGSLVLVIGMMVLPAGTASAAPMPPADPAMVQSFRVQPPPGDDQDRRLANGEFVREGSRTGSGELTIDNGTAHDAVVTLTMSRSPVYSVYVRKGSTVRARTSR